MNPGFTVSPKLKRYDTILFAVFFLGAFTLIAQVVFTREMLVVLSGNELSIGTILAGWLAGIGLGAFIGRFLVSWAHRRHFLFLLMVCMAALFPFQVCLVRVTRAVFSVPVGEYASFGDLLLASFLIFLPTCLATGIFFPVTCSLAAERAPVSIVYIFEAVGSMLGGVVLTFFFLPAIRASGIVLIGSVAALSGALMVIPNRKAGAWAPLLLVAGMLVAVVEPGWLENIDRKAEEARWKASGVLSSVPAGPELVLSRDTVYQNLALFESEGQYTLYGHGRVMFSFPDPVEYEHAVHFIMAQKPDAEKVLLIGGNPVGDIPEILKYPVKQIVYVELDPGVGEMIAAVMPDEYKRAVNDQRVLPVLGDAPRFVSDCEWEFDVVIVNAPEPSTAWENRFYTREFYESVKRLLVPSGFMCTELVLSVRLRSETADIGASVYRTLKSVFNRVLVTAGDKSVFFAGGSESGITFDRRVLYEKSRGADLENRYFLPEFFLGYDDIDPGKTTFVKRRFEEVDAPVNTNARPITYFYNLLLWGRLSGSGAVPLLGRLGESGRGVIIMVLLVMSAVCLVTGIALRKNRRWARIVAGTVIGTSGFCGMSMEILLIFIFQSLFGYIYMRIGLIVAIFMAGLVAGAATGRRLCTRKASQVRRAVLGTEILLLLLALGMPLFLKVPSEIMIYCTVFIVGWAVGTEFPLGNRIYTDAGGRMAAAASITDASDHLGAALGAFVMGVVLMPVFGILYSCLILAAVKLIGIALLMGLRR